MSSLSLCLKRVFVLKRFGLSRLHTKANKKVVLDFLNINTFDDNEIQSSFKKYALNLPSHHDDHNSSNTPLSSQKISHEIFKSNIRRHMINNPIHQDLTEEDILAIFKPPPSSHHLPTAHIPANDLTKAHIHASPSSSAATSEIHTQPTTAATTHTHTIDLAHYTKQLKQFGEKIDDRVWAVGASFLITGASIGIVIPCMPMLVKELAISSTSFGLIVTAYGLAKLLGNVSFAYIHSVILVFYYAMIAQYILCHMYRYQCPLLLLYIIILYLIILLCSVDTIGLLCRYIRPKTSNDNGFSLMCSRYRWD